MGAWLEGVADRYPSDTEPRRRVGAKWIAARYAKRAPKRSTREFLGAIRSVSWLRYESDDRAVSQWAYLVELWIAAPAALGGGWDYFCASGSRPDFVEPGANVVVRMAQSENGWDLNALRRSDVGGPAIHRIEAC